MNEKEQDEIHVDECCICLFAIAPFQALFVAPCSHTFHYKCLRPLLINHPGFLCPLCRKYADLDASCNVEVDEVKSMLSSWSGGRNNGLGEMFIVYYFIIIVLLINSSSSKQW